MAKIYVSATYLDLQEFREKILFHLQKMKQAVTAMEYYLADDRRPADKCIADVEMCDIYVGIFAWRYGTIPDENNPDKLSITEMEYRTARRKGIPCLIFLHDGKSPWSPDLVDDDKARIKAFRKKSESEQTPQWFKNADELASLVGASLYDKLIALGYGLPEKGVTTFDLEKYYAALRKRYGVLALEGLTPPQKEEYLQIQLRSVFVEQSVRENPPPVELPKEVWEKLSRDKEIHPDDLPSGITLDDVRRAREAYYEKPSRPVLDVLTDSRYQHAIILGDPGSGKSTLARYVMLSLIDLSPLPPSLAGKGIEGLGGHLPLLIELRSYAGLCAEGNATTFLEFLEYLGKTEGWHLTQAALHNHLKNDGRAVVIFDGLDEIFDPELRETITNRIVGFTTDYPKTRVIVTSRVIGYRRKILTDAGFTHFTLQDLDEKQVETFVNRWYDLAMSDRPDEAKERRGRILKSFKESASIRQLAGNPMLLTIMAIIGKHQELPRERWKLYDHAASVLIQHWDVNKHLKDVRIDADFIGEDDKKELLRRLAFRMQGGDGGLAGNYTHREQLQEEFEGYLKERYSKAPDAAKIIAEAMIQQFRERNFILSLYGANLYGFVHRAFLEYFCAYAFVWKFEKTKEMDIEQLKTNVYGKHWEDHSWHEVLRLICGMVNEKWVEQLVDYLATDYYTKHYTKSEGEQTTARPYIASLKVGKVVIAGPIPVNPVVLTAYPYPHVSLSPIDCLKEVGNPIWMSEVAELFLKHNNLTARNDFCQFLAGKKYNLSSQVFQLLIECTKNETNLLRSGAITAIVQQFPHDPQTLPLLRDIASNDSDAVVRASALVELAQHFWGDPQTFFLVSRLARNDNSPEPDDNANTPADSNNMTPLELNDRGTAIKLLVLNVRGTAIRLLAQYWPTHPHTLPLLRDRAKNDRVQSLRRQAAKLADAIEQGKPIDEIM